MGIKSAICYLTGKKGERKNKLVTAVSSFAELQQHLSLVEAASSKKSQKIVEQA